MNRRGFIKAFVAGVATVAIGMRVAHGMPELTMPSGDVVGPASAVDNVIVRFDGTIGKHIVSSGYCT